MRFSTSCQLISVAVLFLGLSGASGCAGANRLVRDSSTDPSTGAVPASPKQTGHSQSVEIRPSFPEAGNPAFPAEDEEWYIAFPGVRLAGLNDRKHIRFSDASGFLFLKPTPEVYPRMDPSIRVDPSLQRAVDVPREINAELSALASTLGDAYTAAGDEGRRSRIRKIASYLTEARQFTGYGRLKGGVIRATYVVDPPADAKLRALQ